MFEGQAQRSKCSKQCSYFRYNRCTLRDDVCSTSRYDVTCFWLFIVIVVLKRSLRPRVKPNCSFYERVPDDVLIVDAYLPDAAAVVDDEQLSAVATDRQVRGVSQSAYVNVRQTSERRRRESVN